jgi:2-polyprenyl-3-methyl-5-hydroxy-6-metoxy-1,4-benzoquinol methylase/acyl carrier protein
MGTPVKSEYHRIVDAIIPMWTELLDTKAVTEETEFFKAGGHSLTAMMMVARVERELGITAPLFALASHPTVSAFARYLTSPKAATAVAEPNSVDPKSMDGTESQTEYLLRFNDSDRQDRRNKSFEQYYARAMTSAAHAAFCQQVYGKNFGQHGMADFTQIDIMLGKLKPKAGDVVLDIGCGYGLISKYIAEQTGAKVVGIDLSPSAIEYANTLAAKDDRLQFQVMDLRKLEFPRDTFSHVVSIDTIYYTPSVKTTLQQLKEIGNDRLRLAIIRTFPIRSFTTETWSPDLTELATLLKETFGSYDATDFSKEENEHWRKKVEILDSLKPKFVAEGNEELFGFRYREASYETSIEQFRCMFLSGAPQSTR